MMKLHDEMKDKSGNRERGERERRIRPMISRCQYRIDCSLSECSAYLHVCAFCVGGIDGR